jgi:hypothetical protein
VQIKSQKDLWSGLMFIAVGVAFAIASLNYTFGTSARPGPAYFPFGLGILLAVLGGAVLFSALTGKHYVEGDRIGATAWKPLLLITASVAVFGVVLPKLGMVLSLPLLILVASYAGDEFHWGEVALNSVILTFGSWVIFIWGLNLTIPLWPALGAGK